jgi:hypothetical protein
MYGLDLELRNPVRERKHFKIRKREMNPEFIQQVRVDSGDVSWTASEGYIHFEADVDSGKSATIAIRFRIPSEGDRSDETFSYRFKTALRRYLSEVRDNYVKGG